MQQLSVLLQQNDITIPFFSERIHNLLLIIFLQSLPLIIPTVLLWFSLRILFYLDIVFFFVYCLSVFCICTFQIIGTSWYCTVNFSLCPLYMKTVFIFASHIWVWNRLLKLFISGEITVNVMQTQPVITCSNLTIEIQEQGVTYVQSSQ